MSNDLVFYTHPMSRGRTARWMLEELGQPYQTEILDYATTMKQEPYLSINPMGKVPAIVHRGKTVTETAAICVYLADAFPEAGLAPPTTDRADYYRWIFFTSGPIEAAFTDKSAGFEPNTEQQRMFGYGNFDRAIDAFEHAVTGKDYIAAGKFTAADLLVGATLNFMIHFKLLEPRPVFTAYVDRMKARPAFQRAAEIDDALVPQHEPA